VKTKTAQSIVGRFIYRAIFSIFLTASLFLPPVAAQITNAPFSTLIQAERGVIVVDVEEFASVPGIDGRPAHMNLLLDEPGTSRLFVNDVAGALYSLTYDGSQVSRYLDLRQSEWNVDVKYDGIERGFHSFAFHPDFAREGSAGYGRFYTLTDVKNAPRPPDFRPFGGQNTHHTVLHEWMADDPFAETYDGAAPRELIRFVQPYTNHNGGHIAFNPLSHPGDGDYGRLYVGLADGGGSGDPLNLAQNLQRPYGKILRIDPLGSNSRNERYGIPGDNPFALDPNDGALDEIYAYGLRNPQRFSWDSGNGNLFVADVGQSVVEEISLVPKGANLGWNDWEGSFRFIDPGEVSVSDPRSDSDVVYPVAEFGRFDPLTLSQLAVTGIHVYRNGPIQQLKHNVLFGDAVSGEIFYFDANILPDGGKEGIRRILLREESGNASTLLKIIQKKNEQQGRDATPRADLRFGSGPNHQVFLLNQQDGTIRVLVED